MLTNIEYYNWLIIVPVFGLLFTIIWDAINKHFPGLAGFMIALCVSILCVVSVIDYFPREHESPQATTVAAQEDAPSQETEQHKSHSILLPYLALMMSFLLMLILLMIRLLADGIIVFLRPSYGNKNKISATDRRKGKIR